VSTTGKKCLALFILRVSIFLVMFMWTLDKFVRPDHAIQVFKVFYSIPMLSSFLIYSIGVIELLMIFAFLFGFWKRWSYGAVFCFHLVSTLATFNQYLEPYEGINLLFFTAWPMLAACWLLYVLREEDTFFSFSRF